MADKTKNWLSVGSSFPQSKVQKPVETQKSTLVMMKTDHEIAKAVRELHKLKSKRKEE